MRTLSRSGVFGVGAVAFSLLLPLRFDSRTALSLNEACADITCCFELGSFWGEIPNYKEHHYTSGNGSCPE